MATFNLNSLHSKIPHDLTIRALTQFPDLLNQQNLLHLFINKNFFTLSNGLLGNLFFTIKIEAMYGNNI